MGTEAYGTGALAEGGGDERAGQDGRGRSCKTERPPKTEASRAVACSNHRRGMEAACTRFERGEAEVLSGTLHRKLQRNIG